MQISLQVKLKLYDSFQRSTTFSMARKNRDKVFELVDLKNPYKPKTAIAAERRSEHFYQGISRQTLTRDKDYQDVNKRFGNTVDEVTSEENIKSLEKTSDNVKFRWSNKSFFVILVIRMAVIAVLLLVLSLAVSNKIFLDDYKRNTSDEFNLAMKQLSYLSKSLSHMSAMMEAIIDNNTRDIEREKNRVDEMNIRLGNLHGDVNSSISKISQLHSSINTAMNRINQLRSNTTRDIDYVNSQLRSHATTANSIMTVANRAETAANRAETASNRAETVANRADGRLEHITGSNLLTNCTEHSNRRSISYTDTYRAKNVSVSITYHRVSGIYFN